MSSFPEDIYTEPAHLDFDTLRCLGPLAPMAGIWEGPRGQIAMAVGHAAPDATEFELAARLGDAHANISSNPFLDHAFRTIEYRIRVSIHADGTWSYNEDTVMMIRGQSEPFHHTDRNLLSRVQAPVPNPMAAAAQPAT